MNILENLVAQYIVNKKHLGDQVKEMLLYELKKLFTRHPEVHVVEWAQANMYYDDNDWNSQVDIMVDPDRLYLNGVNKYEQSNVFWDDYKYLDKPVETVYKEFSGLLSSVPAELMDHWFGAAMVWVKSGENHFGVL